MPTYEYECTKCKRTFEVEQRITEPPLGKCLWNCRGTVRRLISSGTSFQLKGSGWAGDGYKR